MFADEIADPSADLVVCALTLAASARAQRLVDLLGALAGSMREEVAMRLRVESGRASARSGVRTIIVFSAGFVALLALLRAPIWRRSARRGSACTVLRERSRGPGSFYDDLVRPPRATARRIESASR